MIHQLAVYSAIGLVIYTIAVALKRAYDDIPPKLNFPVVHPESGDTKDAILEGYKKVRAKPLWTHREISSSKKLTKQKYPDSPFVLPINPPRVVVPMPMFKELVETPEKDMAFRELVHFMFAGQHTHLGVNVDELVAAIRIDLTKGLGSLMPTLQEEAAIAFQTVLKDVGDDWTPMKAQSFALQIVSRVSGRVFVGPELCRTPEYLRTTTMFTADSAKVRNDLQQYNQMIRPFVPYFLDSIKKVKEHLNDAKSWMEPVIADIFSSNNSDEEKAKVVAAGSRGAWISWLLKYLPAHEKTASKLGLIQMQVSFASLHTTTGGTTNALLDLATRPEYQDGLREEINTVLAQDGEAIDDEGQPYITKGSIGKMRKLDSFIKESQRLTPLAFDGMSRRLHKTMTFSNGITVPRGVLLSMPMFAAHQSERNRIAGADPEAEVGNGPLEEFDGYRFARLRELPGNEQRYQATTTGVGQFTYGHGSNACPGRFFAVYIMKIVLIQILREYDIRLSPDIQAAGRPKGKTAGVSNLIDGDVKIELRKRAASN